jgi:hypothetical protein
MGRSLVGRQGAQPLPPRATPRPCFSSSIQPAAASGSRQPGTREPSTQLPVGGRSSSRLAILRCVGLAHYAPRKCSEMHMVVVVGVSDVGNPGSLRLASQLPKLADEFAQSGSSPSYFLKPPRENKGRRWTANGIGQWARAGLRVLEFTTGANWQLEVRRQSGGRAAPRGPPTSHLRGRPWYYPVVSELITSLAAGLITSQLLPSCCLFFAQQPAEPQCLL